MQSNPRCSLATLLGLSLVLAILASPAPVFAGWSWERPPNMVVPLSGKRNPIFYVGEPVRFTMSRSGAVRYEVRNYYGDLVEQGVVTSPLTLNVVQPGWYKLYLYGSADQPPWDYSVGGTMFIVIRNNPNFPLLPPKTVPRSVGEWGGAYSSDVPTRSVLGIGPNRWYVQDASDPDKAISLLENNIALERQYYLPYDPVRKRDLIIAFPNGTADLAGVRKIVEHFKDSVKYWEPRNEPQDTPAAAFVQNEMKPFYETVKSVSPDLKVIGPGTVSIGPGMLKWIDAFFAAGGGNYIDGFSFHAYNSVNGDLWLARHALEELNKVLAKYGAEKLEKWQTEQGYFAAVYGSYQPRLQGRWTMLQMMVYEQFGIPKEHNHYWYDRSHGFWDFPTWWENEDDSGNGLNPAAVLMRVWSEELYGTTFRSAYDFGASRNDLYLGSLFEGSGRRVAAFMSAGSTDGAVKLSVTGSSSKLRTVSAFGVEGDITVTRGIALLPVGELPVYVELDSGQDISVDPADYGPDYALLPGVSVTTSMNSPDDPGKLINNQLENWYYAQGNSPGPWNSGPTAFPAWIDITLPSARTVDKVVVIAAPPWQSQGTLLDYELQYDKEGQWVTLAHVQEPAKTWKVYTPTVRCTVDSFFSDRWVFEHTFAPVHTQRLRLLVRDCTWGGGATKDVAEAGGQTGAHQITLREIRIYNSQCPSYAIRGHVTGPAGNPLAGVPVSLGGWRSASTVTDSNGKYVFEAIPEGVNCTVAAPLSDYQYQFEPPVYTTANLDSDKTADFSASTIPLSVGSGLVGSYYNKPDLSAFGYSRIDPRVSFNWGKGSPAPNIVSDYFSIRWTGQIQPRFSEEYTFRTVLDDGVRLWVDGRLIIDSWAPTGSKNLSGSIPLTAGHRYDIRLEYNESYNDAGISLYWSSASQPAEIVPQSQLYPNQIHPAQLPAIPDLHLVTSSPPENAVPGSRVLITVTCTNTSSGPAVNAVVKGVVPEKTTYVDGSATDGGVYDEQAGVVRWTLPRLEGGATKAVSYRVRIK